ncbi:MAG: fructosamine kinase family protein [Mariniphaga sp.]|nr:fructosamine kinase family protein [Mariniphaga sp.]
MNSILEIVQKRLAEKLNLEIEIQSNSSLGGGCINHASKLVTSAGVFFLKWNNHCASDVFLREAESLKELRKEQNPYLKIPEVILYKKLDSTPGFLLLEYLEPSSGFDNDANMGRGLATIHLITSEKFGFSNDNYCGDTIQDNLWNINWIDFYGQQRLLHLVNLIKQERSLDSSSIKLYEKLYEKLPELIPEESTPALIHGDLWSGNYMLTSQGPALIDPASYYADREMEMGIMTMFGGFSQQFWSGYNEVYPLPNDWADRNKLYQLYHILNHYYIFGGGYGHQAISVARKYI